MMNIRVWVPAIVVCAVACTGMGCHMNGEKSQQNRTDTPQPVRYDQNNLTPQQRMGGSAGDFRDVNFGKNMKAADDISQAVSAMKEVRRAATITMGDTAYVGVQFAKDYQGQVTQQMKDRVAKKARQVNPGLKQVFVSANPGFVNSLEDYAKSVREGRPVKGFINEFRDLMQRTFPEAR